MERDSMASKVRSLEKKIGPTVIDFVAKAVEMLAERDQSRLKLFRAGRNADNQLVSKVWSEDLIDAMALLCPETLEFPDESLKRALSDTVQFLTNEELKSGKHPRC